MKILFTVSHFGFLRNFEFALRELARRGHTIHLSADRRENLGGMRTIELLTRDYPNITYGWGPNPKSRTWHDFGGALRLSLDYWHYLHPRYADSPKLRARAASQVPPFAVRVGGLRVIGSRPGIALLTAGFRMAERAVPYAPEVEQFLAAQRPDVLLVTPLLYFGSQQVDYVRAARALGMRTVLCVGSWDHLTTKGMIHEIPDHVTVWNEAQRVEAQAIHGVSPAIVSVTGAQAYDHWFTAKPSVSREEFCRRVGLAPDRPYLLYLCSSPFIAPHEVGFVTRWIRAIRSAADPAVREAGVLVRPHPQNFEQWRDVDFSTFGNVAIVPRGGANPVDSEARAEYFDSMYYSAAVVGVNTSALIESGIVGRPVFTVLDGEFAGTQEGTLHFQHLKNVNGGLLHAANDLGHHLEQLRAAFSGELVGELKGQNFVQAFVRPRGLEVPAATVFADTIEAIGHEAAPAATRSPRWAPFLRPVMYPAAQAVRAAVAKRRAVRKEREKRSTSGQRILFAMASPEYLRYYDTTIELLASRGHEVIVGVNHQKDKKHARLEGLPVHEGIRTIGIIPKREGFWGRVGRGLRGVTDFSRYLHPRFADAVTLRARMKRKVLPPAFRLLDRIRSLSESNARRLLRLLAVCERAIPSGRALEEFLRDLAPDLVVVSPLIDAASDQVEIVKSAQALGIRTAACIASWDNLTNKGVMRVEPDRVVVWNEIQRREAIDYHAIPAEKVAVTGAQPFDRWFERRPSRSRDEFLAMVGLVGDRPYLLFTCSSGFISQSPAEVAFVRSWVTALRRSPHQHLRTLGVLVRPHPYNTAAWETADLSDVPDVAVWPRQRYNAVDEKNRAAYFDSLYYSAAVVGVNTSAMIEAAIVGRPVFSLLTGEFAGTQQGTLHFHHLLPENGGCVRVASTFEDHFAQIDFALSHLDEASSESRQFVKSFIRPHGLDRPCTPIIADVLESLAQEERPAPATVPPWVWFVRPVLALVAVVAGAVNLVVEPRTFDRLRKNARSRVHRAKKRAGKIVRERARFVRVGGRRTIRLTRSAGRAVRHAPSALAGWVVMRPVRHALRLVRRGRYHAAMFLKHGAAGNTDGKS